MKLLHQILHEAIIWGSGDLQSLEIYLLVYPNIFIQTQDNSKGIIAL